MPGDVRTDVELALRRDDDHGLTYVGVVVDDAFVPFTALKSAKFDKWARISAEQKKSRSKSSTSKS